MLIARELGCWGLPSRDAKLVVWLLKAMKRSELRPKVKAMLETAELATAKSFLQGLIAEQGQRGTPAGDEDGPASEARQPPGQRQSSRT